MTTTQVKLIELSGVPYILDTETGEIERITRGMYSMLKWMQDTGEILRWDFE